MFSVEPTLARTFFRSGAEVLVGGRLSLGAEDVGLADVGFLSMAEVPEGRGDVGVGFTRLGTVPAGGAAPGTGAFFFMALLEVLFERLKSADADFVTVFLMSVGFPSVLIPAGFLGRAMELLLLLGPAEAREAAGVAFVAFGTVWVLLEPGLKAGAEADSLEGVAGLEGVAFFSGIFASAIGLDFTSFEGEMEGLAVAAAGRLGRAAGTEPEARLMGFLVDPPKVVGDGCLGREVGCVLAFDVEVFAG